MNKKLTKFAAWALLLLASHFLVACNTVEGVGEDVEEAGEAVEDAAD